MTELIKIFEHICWLTKGTSREPKTIKTLSPWSYRAWRLNHGNNWRNYKGLIFSGKLSSEGNFRGMSWGEKLSEHAWELCRIEETVAVMSRLHFKNNSWRALYLNLHGDIISKESHWLISKHRLENNYFLLFVSLK